MIKKYDSKYNKIIYDILLGSILIGLISYATINFDTNPEYLKIVAYLWGVPLLYFYFVYIIYPDGNKALKDFTIHGLLGIILTTVIMIITYVMIINNYDKYTILMVNLFYGIITLFLYFYYEIYNKF